MKAALFLFLAINCAALIWGTGYAAPSGAESQQQSSHSASKTANNDQQSAEQAAPLTAAKIRGTESPRANMEKVATFLTRITQAGLQG